MCRILTVAFSLDDSAFVTLVTSQFCTKLVCRPNHKVNASKMKERKKEALCLVLVKTTHQPVSQPANAAIKIPREKLDFT